jgi:hypothetical protein
MYQPSGFVSATMITQKRMIWSQPITVMALTLQARCPAQQRQEHHKQAADERNVGQQQFDKQQHGSEPFRPQQRVGEVEQEAERDGTGECIIEDHGPLPYNRSQT